MTEVPGYQAVIEMTCALSSELVPGRLMGRLLTGVLEHTGARRGVLILKKPEGLFITAEGSAEAEDVVVEQAVPVESCTVLPASVIHHVVRTGDAVLVHDTASGGAFSEDPYFVATRPTSLLCSPLVNEGATTGALYLEAEATCETFTCERQELLRVLSRHAAVCLANAALCARLKEQNQALERNVGELRQQLVAQDKLASLGALTAGITHELQNPLNFVTNFSNLSTRLAVELEETLRGRAGQLDAETLEDALGLLEDLRQNSQRIHTHGKRASDIIKTMLRHSRRSEGTRSRADFNTLVRDSLGLAVQGLRSRSSGATVETESELDATVGTVELVASDISRLFINILENAFYATLQKQQKAGVGFTPCVHIRTRRLGDTVELRVRDNGTGIPEHVREKLFHPFFTTKPAGVGTGLGLSLCHDIVQEHHGEIRVESAPGEYAEFIITLPAPAAASAA
jgi:signal transduction histidine kinase